MSDDLPLLLKPESRSLPLFLYGTAWKEDATQRLTELAIAQGFRGIDTANQRKHYHEAAVGQGIQAAIELGVVTREQLFLQTKFTFQRGQDHRLPYDPKASIAVQVQQSFSNSLEHLHTDYLDSYVLHGPTQRIGLATDDWSAWNAMEELHDGGQVRALGISNVSFDQLKSLCEKARVRPRFVQNRCYAAQEWDRSIRQYCKSNDIIYQGFSLLTANATLLQRAEMRDIARRYGRTVSQIIFRFAMDVGMLPLTGTTNAEHMRADLDVVNFQLTSDEVDQIERVGMQ